MGCKWSLVQIQSPRLRSPRDSARVSGVFVCPGTWVALRLRAGVYQCGEMRFSVLPSPGSRKPSGGRCAAPTPGTPPPPLAEAQSRGTGTGGNTPLASRRTESPCMSARLAWQSALDKRDGTWRRWAARDLPPVRLQNPLLRRDWQFKDPICTRPPSEPADTLLPFSIPVPVTTRSGFTSRHT